VGCHESGKLKSADEEPDNGKTAIFLVMGDQAYYDSPHYVNYWNSLEKTRNNIHIFGAKDSYLTSFQGHHHKVQAPELASTMRTIAQNISISRLIIFVDIPGVHNGQWNYKQVGTPDLNEDFLIASLPKNNTLQQVLIIPIATEKTKPFMDRFAEKFLSNINPPFEKLGSIKFWNLRQKRLIC